jgi:hypothetical protein
MKQQDFLDGKIFDIKGVNGSFRFQSQTGDILRCKHDKRWYKYAEVIYISDDCFHAHGYFFNTRYNAMIVFLDCTLNPHLKDSNLVQEFFDKLNKDT